MAFLGKITEKCLLICGVSPTDIESIKCGNADWNIDEAIPEKGSNLLTLTLELDDDQIQTCRIRNLTDENVAALKSYSEFEERNHNAPEEDRPPEFPAGKFNDWVGVAKIDRRDIYIAPFSSCAENWIELSKEYRKAADILSESDLSIPTPFLYMCRHTLELQLKAILCLKKGLKEKMKDAATHEIGNHTPELQLTSGLELLSQEMKNKDKKLGEMIMKEDANRKGNLHRLKPLWEATSPIAQFFNTELKKDPNFVSEVILRYHEIDELGFHLRYPSYLDNSPIEHPKYLQSFDKSGHAEKFQKASDALDAVICSMKNEEFYLTLSSSHSSE